MYASEYSIPDNFRCKKKVDFLKKEEEKKINRKTHRVEKESSEFYYLSTN